MALAGGICDPLGTCSSWKKNDIAPAGIEHKTWSLIQSPQIVEIYNDTHVFATVICSFHCFKIGSYKFLAEGYSVYLLTAYCVSIPPLYWRDS